MKINVIAASSLMLATLLAGCANEATSFIDEKDRISIFSPIESIKLAKSSIKIPAASKYPNWPNTDGTSSHSNQNLLIGKNPKFFWKTQTRSNFNIADSSGAIANWRAVEPVAYSGIVYTLNSNLEVSAYDANNGRLKWRTKIKRGVEDGEPLPQGGGLSVSENILVVVTGDGQLIGMEPKTGKAKWYNQLGFAVRSAPVLLGADIVVLAIDSSIHKINAATGKTEWSYQPAHVTSLSVGSVAPAIDGNLVVVRRHNGEILALNRENGLIVWADIQGIAFGAQLTDETRYTLASPVVTPDAVIADTLDNQIVAINRRDGQRVWATPTTKPQTPAIAGNIMFVLEDEWKLRAVSGVSGDTIWLTNLPKTLRLGEDSVEIKWLGPVLAGDRLLVTGSEGSVISISPINGKPLGRINLGTPMVTSPIIANSTIFLLDAAENLIAIK